MDHGTDILNELKTLSPLLAGLEKVNVFTVPPGYFESLGETVIACIYENDGVLTTSNKEISFDVPPGYFENLASAILGKIKQGQSVPEELRTLCPALYNLQKENVFEVPPGYFDNLPGTILQKVQVGKVVPMHKRNVILKYAAAAILAGAVALGVYKYANTPATSVNSTTAVATLDPTIQKGKSMDEKQFNETLNSLSAEDIAKYLDKNADETDLAALASTLDENNLPSQDDYLLDEKTLDNYLKDIDTKNNNN